MAALILRLVSRQARAPEFRRFEGGAVRIGRALDNDLILADPYVGAEQFRILREGEALVLEVLDRTNPVSVNGHRRAEARIVLAVGDEVAIGHSGFAVLREDTPVLPARELAATPWARLGAWRPALAVLALAAASGAALWIDFQDTVEKPDWGGLASGVLFLAGIVLAWAASWAVVGRLLRHQTHYFSHLALAAVVVLLTMIVTLLAEYLSYASGLAQAARILDWALNLLLLFLLLYGDLRMATNLRRPASVAMLSVLLPVALFGVLHWVEREQFAPQPEAETLLRAPFAKLREGMPFEAYEDELGELFGELRAD